MPRTGEKCGLGFALAAGWTAPPLYPINRLRCVGFVAHQPGAQVAQLVEQRTENPRVGGSIPPLATTPAKD